MTATADLVKDAGEEHVFVVTDDAGTPHLVAVDLRCASCRSQPCPHVAIALEKLNKEAPCPSSRRAA